MDSGAVQPQTSDCGWGNQHAESFGPQSRGCRLSWRQSRDEDARVPNSPEAQGLATRLPHSRPARVCETCGHTDVSPALAPSFPLPRSPCGEGRLGRSGEDTHASPAKRPHTRHEGQGPGQGKVSSSGMCRSDPPLRLGMGPGITVVTITPKMVGGAPGARKVQNQIGQGGNGSGPGEGTAMCSLKWTLYGLKGGLPGTRKR